jgi:ribosome maturation factor RimP
MSELYKAEKEKISNGVKKLIGPFLRAEEVELVEIIYRRERGSMVLRLLVDKEEGINLDECSSLNRKIGEALDEVNLIDEPYILEVSSPGIDRPLKSSTDFKRVRGKLVKLILNSEIESKGIWIGEVVGVNEENVTIKTKDKKLLKIPLSRIVRARREIMF